jgi:predicted short-subunit dehydrogenase-like oxidoreductase (DUF2520 family)
MGELDPTTTRALSRPLRCAVVGRGRLGGALAGALAEAGHDVDGPLGRGADAGGCDVALLCVPDAEIGAAAAAIAPDVLVGHCSGASGLSPLGAREGFSLHPLMTVTGAGAGASLAGAGCAIAGSSPQALATAQSLTVDLGMVAVEVADQDRAAYHAAASIASNYLVALQDAAERLAATAGLDREHLIALVRATVDNWAALGPERALTGPVARGDEETVERQRRAVAERTPELTELFEAMTDRARTVAGRQVAA